MIGLTTTIHLTPSQALNHDVMEIARSSIDWVAWLRDLGPKLGGIDRIIIPRKAWWLLCRRRRVVEAWLVANGQHWSDSLDTAPPLTSDGMSRLLGANKDGPIFAGAVHVEDSDATCIEIHGRTESLIIEGALEKVEAMK